MYNILETGTINNVKWIPDYSGKTNNIKAKTLVLLGSAGNLHMNIAISEKAKEETLGLMPIRMSLRCRIFGSGSLPNQEKNTRY